MLYQDQPELQDHRGHKVFQDQPEPAVQYRDQQGQLAHKDQADRQADHKDHKVFRDQPEPGVQGRLDHKVLQDHKDP